ncbi:unnamed protein product [Pleuronectes platessa]|uniref:Uncharacterized protein n=1 Tax=Pleuronectes platessa TaxID=8262 RepID=A0A9N7VUM3_PLEPL|nr:unnamed protein product [Pleuronectes platessa]
MCSFCSCVPKGELTRSLKSRRKLQVPGTEPQGFEDSLQFVSQNHDDSRYLWKILTSSLVSDELLCSPRET